MTTTHTNDLLADTGAALVEEFEAATEKFEQESGEALSAMENGLRDVEQELAEIMPEIEDAAREASAEIDDAVLELLSDEEME
jgi:hypothetical protein